jgi:hypothetical protein
MFDSQCDWAALVYEKDQDRDQILPEFASDPHGDSVYTEILNPTILVMKSAQEGA